MNTAKLEKKTMVVSPQENKKLKDAIDQYTCDIMETVKKISVDGRKEITWAEAGCMNSVIRDCIWRYFLEKGLLGYDPEFLKIIDEDDKLKRDELLPTVRDLYERIATYISGNPAMLSAKEDLFKIMEEDIFTKGSKQSNALKKIVGQRYNSLQEVQKDIEDITGKKIRDIEDSNMPGVRTDFIMSYRFTDSDDFHILHYLKDNAGNYYITEA